MIQANEQAIRQVVQEVLAQLGTRAGRVRTGNGRANGDWGVFRTVDDAVAAATDGFEKFRDVSMEDRAKAIACVYRICDEQAEELGRHGTRRDEDRPPRSQDREAADREARPGHRVPQVRRRQRRPRADRHRVRPVRRDRRDHAGHALAADLGRQRGQHAGGRQHGRLQPASVRARIACEGVRRFNQAIHEAIGLENLITIVGEPTLETAGQIFDHRGVRLLVATGGPGVARAALASKKRAIVAGPGNPPVVVDETADLENAARSIVKGAAYDNNLLCIGEKEVFRRRADLRRAAGGGRPPRRFSPQRVADRAADEAGVFAAGETGGTRGAQSRSDRQRREPCWPR